MNDKSELDKIDDEIARLFRRRTEVADEIYAGGRGDPAAERATLTHVAEVVGPDLERGAATLFSTIFGLAAARRRSLAKGDSPVVESICRAVAQAKPFPTRTMVACAGMEGSYAQQAASLMFRVPTILFFSGFEAVFEAVEKGMCPYGILPIENSAAGSVAQVYDLMVRHRFHIVRSVRVKIDHALLGRHGAKAADIRKVSSHPHALAQCSAFLKSHPEMRVVPCENTAAAARDVAEHGDMSCAAIASRACADLYGLDVLADKVSDTTFNYTRFICISRDLEIAPDADKFSVMLSLPHRPGSLSATSPTWCAKPRSSPRAASSSTAAIRRTASAPAARAAATW